MISYPVKALVLKVSLKPHKKLSLLLEEAETSVYCFLPAATARGAVTEAKSIISLYAILATLGFNSAFFFL